MADHHFAKALQRDDRTWCGCAESSQWGQSGGLSSLQVPRPPSTLTCSARWSTWPTCPRSLPPPSTRTCSAAPPPLPPLPQHLFLPPRSCKCTVCKKRKCDKNKKYHVLHPPQKSILVQVHEFVNSREVPSCLRTWGGTNQYQAVQHWPLHHWLAQLHESRKAKGKLLVFKSPELKVWETGHYIHTREIFDDATYALEIKGGQEGPYNL